MVATQQRIKQSAAVNTRCCDPAEGDVVGRKADHVPRFLAQVRLSAMGRRPVVTQRRGSPRCRNRSCA